MAVTVRCQTKNGNGGLRHTRVSHCLRLNVKHSRKGGGNVQQTTRVSTPVEAGVDLAPGTTTIHNGTMVGQKLIVANARVMIRAGMSETSIVSARARSEVFQLKRSLRSASWLKQSKPMIYDAYLSWRKKHPYLSATTCLRYLRTYQKAEQDWGYVVLGREFKHEGWTMKVTLDDDPLSDLDALGTMTDEPHPDNYNNPKWRPYIGHLQYHWFRSNYTRVERVTDYVTLGCSKQVANDLALEGLHEDCLFALGFTAWAVCLTVSLGEHKLVKVQSGFQQEPVDLLEVLPDLADSGMTMAKQHIQGLWSMYCSEVLSRQPSPYTVTTVKNGVNNVNE